MRTTQIGGKELELRATPLALLFYKQAFNKDLVADITKLQTFQGLEDGDFGQFDSLLLLQVAYAMNRAAKPKDGFPSFERWLEALENIDFGEPQWLVDIVEEAIDGFFRSAGTVAPEKGKSK